MVCESEVLISVKTIIEPELLHDTNGQIATSAMVIDPDTSDLPVVYVFASPWG